MHERPNFITRYYFENKIKRRMICLFTYNIKNEDTLKLPFFKKGKFWSENEIDMNRDKSVFTDAFEKEINLLKLSVFAIQH